MKICDFIANILRYYEIEEYYFDSKSVGRSGLVFIL